MRTYASAGAFAIISGPLTWDIWPSRPRGGRLYVQFAQNAGGGVDFEVCNPLFGGGRDYSPEVLEHLMRMGLVEGHLSANYGCSLPLPDESEPGWRDAVERVIQMTEEVLFGVLNYDPHGELRVEIQVQ